MDVRVHGPARPGPFLSARDLLLTEHDLARPVEVHVREDPDERTWNAHYEDRHVLNISRQAATSAMARGLALHEYAHMVRHEQAHPSHTQRTDEALFLALAGRSVEQHKLTHCYQIANHMKDIYADDITLRVGPSDKLVSFLESRLAAAVADHPGEPPSGAMTAARTGGFSRLSPAADPEITAVNAAFALALVERHDLVSGDHRIYDLSHAANRDAAGVDVETFKQRFRSLGSDPDESTYRKALVDATRDYVEGPSSAAD
jgi:hypothetical protein